MKIALFVHCFFPDHFYGTEKYTLDLALRLQEMGHEPTVVSATFEGEPACAAPITRYEFRGIPVINVDKNSFPHRGFGESYLQPSLRPVFRGILGDLRPDVVHVTHLINHTAALLDEAAEQRLPIVGTLTDFFGFCLNNKLEAADGTLCAGPNADRTNCASCVVKAAGSRGGASRTERLIARGPMPVVAGALLARGTRLPVIGQTAVGRDMRAVVRRPEVLRLAYEAYDALIAPTTFLRGAYQRNGVGGSIREIRFGVDLDRTPKPRRPAGDPLRVGYIGQMVAHKGVDLLVRAFAGIRSSRTELHLFGPEDQDSRYAARLRQLAEGQAVHFRGTFPNDEMASILVTLDLLVIPSRWYENSPLVLLNALASHTPVLISDVAGMTEFVTDGVNGFTFRRGDAGDLARVLSRALDDPHSLRAMAAMTEYTRTTLTMAEDTLSIYEQVIQAA